MVAEIFGLTSHFKMRCVSPTHPKKTLNLALLKYSQVLPPNTPHLNTPKREVLLWEDGFFCGSLVQVQMLHSRGRATQASKHFSFKKKGKAKY